MEKAKQQTISLHPENNDDSSRDCSDCSVSTVGPSYKAVDWEYCQAIMAKIISPYTTSGDIHLLFEDLKANVYHPRQLALVCHMQETFPHLDEWGKKLQINDFLDCKGINWKEIVGSEEEQEEVKDRSDSSGEESGADWSPRPQTPGTVVHRPLNPPSPLRCSEAMQSGEVTSSSMGPTRAPPYPRPPSKPPPPPTHRAPAPPAPPPPDNGQDVLVRVPGFGDVTRKDYRSLGSHKDMSDNAVMYALHEMNDESIHVFVPEFGRSMQSHSWSFNKRFKAADILEKSLLLWPMIYEDCDNPRLNHWFLLIAMMKVGKVMVADSLGSDWTQQVEGCVAFLNHQNKLTHGEHHNFEACPNLEAPRQPYSSRD